MKIGIIADIHAQYESLEKALNLLADQEVDTIICAGDLVNRGLEGEQVVRKIQQLEIPCVQGNHDEWSAEIQEELYDSLPADELQHVLDSFAQEKPIQSPLLSPDTIKYLSDLPFSLTFNWENTKVMMVHGSPKDNMDHFSYSMSESALKQRLEGVDADIVICGHTHRPLLLVCDDTLILNPGGVYRSKMHLSSHTCAVLTLPEKVFRVFSLEVNQSYTLE